MRRLRVLLAFVLLVVASADLRTQQQPLRVHFIDVGQGDAVLIQSPSGQNVVYDAGEDPVKVRDYLTSIGVTDVGLVIASHNHADHIGGLPEVIRHYRPQFYMDNGVPATTLAYSNLIGALTEVGSQLLEPVERRILLGDASLVVVPPPGNAAWDQNDNSIGVIVEYGSFRLFLGGDAEGREWAWWLTNHRTLLAPVVAHKASHHGSSNGDTREGLVQLAPRTVVIGVGEGNTYGHPTAAALGLYADARATVYRTDRNGTSILQAQSSGEYSVTVERGAGASPPPATATPNVTVQSITASTERHSSGNLNYPLTFQVRESGGVAVTLSPISVSLSFPSGTGNAALTPVEAFGSATLAGGATITSRQVVLQGGSSSQASQVTIRVPWASASGATGTAEGTGPISPAAACSAPGAPSSLTASASGTTVSFSWSSVSGATDYSLSGGTSPGSSTSLSTTTSATSYSWMNVSSGTYYARVRARSSCGTGSASNEATVTVSTGGGGTGGQLPSSWSGTLPPRSGTRPVCQASLPSVAQCVNNLVGPPQAICSDRVYSCSTGSGTCSGHGGVYCWRN